VVGGTSPWTRRGPGRADPLGAGQEIGGTPMAFVVMALRGNKDELITGCRDSSGSEIDTDVERRDGQWPASCVPLIGSWYGAPRANQSVQCWCCRGREKNRDRPR